MSQNIIEPGIKVEFENREFTVLGFAASVDSKGLPLVEIAWNDFTVSPTGYLAVPRDELVLTKKV